jgi:glycosyltransferase involved in cell wall biosynthesis
MTNYHISVCICTYKRPQLLSKLLSKLQNQITENLFTYSAVVVDNDALQSAKKTVREWQSRSTISIDYHCEPEQNISMARNKTIANAFGDYVALIDDDEFPDTQWLLNLYKAIQQYGADGILGPVLPHFEIAPPKWVIKGSFFKRPQPITGQKLSWQDTRTGNVLLKRNLFAEGQIWFDPAFGSGGEDRDFFRRMIAKGSTFIWSNDAPVFEIIPPQRWDKKILIKRALLRGKMALNAAKSKPLSVSYSLVAVILYTCFLPISFLLGHHVFMKYLIKTCDHIGKVTAFLGFNLVNEKYIGV